MTMRVVSLVPSITETLLAWGITPVGVTRFCEQPALQAVGGTKDPDHAAIAALRPDLVLLNDEENRLEDHDALVAAGLPLHVVRVDAVADVGPALAQMADRLGIDAPDTLTLPPAASACRARVFVPIWKRPWMTIGEGTYGDSVLAHLGLANVFGGDGSRYPETTLEEAAAREPDLVLAPSEPYPFAERHRELLDSVARVVLVDGQDLFWWGARTPAALGRLAGAIPT